VGPASSGSSYRASALDSRSVRSRVQLGKPFFPGKAKVGNSILSLTHQFVFTSIRL